MTWIIPVAIVAAIAIATISIVNSIKRKIARSSGILGTLVNLAKDISQMDPSELNAEPGPKSISGMTTLLLPNIHKDFPDFEYNEAKSRANNVLTTYLTAISRGDAETLSEGTSELRTKLETEIHNISSRSQAVRYDNIHIHQTELNQYRKAGGRCIITFQMSVEYYKYTLNSSGSIVEGSRDKKVQTRYNVDMIYIQDREWVDATMASAKGINCPNCGAPLTMLGAKKCTYCGAPVVEINAHAWNFGNVEEFIRV